MPSTLRRVQWRGGCCVAAANHLIKRASTACATDGAFAPAHPLRRAVQLAEQRRASSDAAPLLSGSPRSPGLKRSSVSFALRVAGPLGGWRAATKALLLGSRLNVLLLAFPLACLSVGTHWGDGWTFLFSLLGICPLAERLGFITEQLAQYTNSTLGGLLNATFGNLTEVIVSCAALRKGLLRIVQLSLLGSILSNMLLVLGCAFLGGGLKYREQRFNAAGASVNVTLLMLAVLAHALPALLGATHTELRGSASLLALSRFTSFIMLMCYGAFLYFQLVTHRELYEDEPAPKADKAAGGGAAAASAASEAPAGGESVDAEESKEDDEDELVLSFGGALACLAVVTALIAVLSEFLVDAIEGAAEAWGLPLAFISVILLPIVGNAAEHMSAVIFALQNKLDLAIGIAVGSSTQIALLVTPGCVLLAGAMRKPLDLNLQPFETGALLVGVLMLAFTLQEGRTNWLKGAALVAAYVVVAAAFAAHDDPRLAAEHAGG
jgi:Ca2+:H+ antiporter